MPVQNPYEQYQRNKVLTATPAEVTLMLYEGAIKFCNIAIMAIENNEMDLVIFLRDPLNPKKHEPDVNNVVRLCDTHNIPLATNLASAELLIKALDRGDLEWREMYK